MLEHEKINYVEYGSTNLAATKAFFQSAFNWQFEDFGSDYTAFTGGGLDGGFFQSDKVSQTNTGGALLVLYSENLEHTLASVSQAGGQISQSIFDFPGGRRFHFNEPGGNEMAVWAQPV